jgi:hypothetical protein
VLQAAPLLAALDFDGDRSDELVLLGHRRRSDGIALEGAAVVADVGSDVTLGWTLGTPAVLDELYGAGLATLPNQSPVLCNDVNPNGFDAARYGGQIQAGDVDGDGTKDLVALGVVAEQYDACGEVSAGRTVLSVFRNGGDGQLFAGPPHVLTGFEAIAPAGPTSFALIQADADAAMEILLATGSELYLADFDPVNVALANLRRLDGPTGGALPGGSFATADDFDGDGVQDIAVVGADELELYLGKPLP